MSVSQYVSMSVTVTPRRTGPTGSTPPPPSPCATSWSRGDNNLFWWIEKNIIKDELGHLPNQNGAGRVWDFWTQRKGEKQTHATLILLSLWNMEENKCLSRNWLKNYLDLAQVNLIETVSFKLDYNSLTDDNFSFQYCWIELNTFI